MYVPRTLVLGKMLHLQDAKKNDRTLPLWPLSCMSLLGKVLLLQDERQPLFVSVVGSTAAGEYEKCCFLKRIKGEKNYILFVLNEEDNIGLFYIKKTKNKNKNIIAGFTKHVTVFLPSFPKRTAC